MLRLVTLAALLFGAEGFTPIRRPSPSPKFVKSKLASLPVPISEATQSSLFSLPSLQVATGDLGNAQVIGYFLFLSALIVVPFVGGTFDTIRISEFREKRQDFIDAIEEEIEDLNKEGTPEALATAKELRAKLSEVYDEVALDALKDEENKFLGLNKYIMQMQGKPLSDDPPEKRSAAAASSGSGFVPGEVVDPKEPKGNREERRLAKKLRKRRAPKRIDSRNP